MRCLAALVLVSLIVLPASAQCRPRLGFELGAALAAIDRPGQSDDRNSHMRGGPSAGLVVAFPSSRPVSFVTGLRYDRKGGRHEYDPPVTVPVVVITPKAAASFEETEWTLDYLTVPLLARFTIPHETASLMIEAGFEGSVLLSSSVHEESGAESSEVDGAFTDGDIGLRAGAGLMIPAFGQRILARAGFVYGLTDIRGSGGMDENANQIASLYNRAVILTLGMSF